MAKEGTKICKHCKSEISAGAKICPNCRKKQGGIVKWIVIGVVAVIIIAAVATGGGDNDSASKKNKSETASNVDESSEATDEKVEEEETIEYQEITVEQLMSDLEANAMNAADTYTDNYYAISGKLSNIDAQGNYINIVDPNDEWAIIGVQCYIKTDDVKDAIKTISKGSKVIVKGKITDVGEVLGYSLDIDSIEQQ